MCRWIDLGCFGLCFLDSGSSGGIRGGSGPRNLPSKGGGLNTFKTLCFMSLLSYFSSLLFILVHSFVCLFSHLVVIAFFWEDYVVDAISLPVIRPPGTRAAIGFQS